MDEEKKTASEVEHEFERPEEAFKEIVTDAFARKAALVADLLSIKVNDLHPWYETKTAVLSDTTNEILYSRRVNTKWILVLTHISMKEATTQPTTIELAIERGGETIVLNRDVPSAVDISINWDGQVILIEGDRIKCTSYGGTLNDVVDVSMSGYLIKA